MSFKKEASQLDKIDVANLARIKGLEPRNTVIDEIIRTAFFISAIAGIFANGMKLINDYARRRPYSQR